MESVRSRSDANAKRAGDCGEPSARKLPWGAGDLEEPSKRRPCRLTKDTCVHYSEPRPIVNSRREKFVSRETVA